MNLYLLPLVLVALLYTAPASATSVFSSAANYSGGSDAGPGIIAKLNNDNFPDIVTINYFVNTISILINNQNGTFAAPVTYGTGASPIFVVAADLDADTDTDLAVANSGGNSISILLNNGNGTFDTEITYATGLNPSAIVATDVDGDGDIDLATANFDGDDISILLNNGNGTFTAPTHYAVADQVSSISAADFDGDADKDLIVGSSSLAQISVILNNGNGVFGAPTNYATDLWPTSIAVANFDGINGPDIATSNLDADNVSIFLNNGNGIFGTAVNYTTGDGSFFVTARDLDGDADADLAVANYNDNTASLLWNNGDGAFGSLVPYAVGTGPYSVDAADLDGDTDQDLAITNTVSQDVSILFNLTPHSTALPARPPLINVRKVPTPLALPNGPGPVTYAYTVTNPGTITMTNITLTDDSCASMTYLSGDENNNTWLETNETWRYSCTTRLAQTTVNYATARGLGNGMASVDTAIAEVFVGIPIIPPLIHVVKTPSPFVLPFGGGSVTYTYVVTNPGTVPLTAVTVTDDECSTVTRLSGDANNDALLQPTETWAYTCTTNLAQTTVNTAIATGHANGLTAVDTSIVTVVVANSPLPPPLIHVVKKADPILLGASGGWVTYTYTVTNPGLLPLTDVRVTDDTCPAVSYTSGDGDQNRLLEPSETWIYACQKHLTATTVSSATASGITNGIRATDTSLVNVIASPPTSPPLTPPTPTLPDMGAHSESFPWLALISSIFVTTILLIAVRQKRNPD